MATSMTVTGTNPGTHGYQSWFNDPGYQETDVWYESGIGLCTIDTNAYYGYQYVL